MKNQWIIASKQNSSISLLCVAMLAVLPIGTADAATADSRGYVGTRVGLSDDALTNDENSFVGELFGGIRINDHWAVEASWFGTDKDTGRFPDIVQNTEDNQLRLRGATLSARYTWPLTERARVHLRGGIANFDVRYRFSISVQSYPPLSELDNIEVYRAQIGGNSFGGVLALGIDTRLGDRWRVGAELQHYRGDLVQGQEFDGMVFRSAFDQPGSLQAAVFTLAAEF